MKIYRIRSIYGNGKNKAVRYQATHLSQKIGVAEIGRTRMEAITKALRKIYATKHAT